MTFPVAGRDANQWWLPADAAERDTIGSNEALQVGDKARTLDDAGEFVCTAVTGPNTSTWSQEAGAAADLEAVLGVGAFTANQPIRGSNAATAVLAALSLIAGTPTNASEIGARALLQGGGASSGAVVGGLAEVAGGPPPAGQSQQGGLGLLHGYDATGADNQAGDTLVRGGDDEQGFLTTAGTLTCRAGNTIGNRNGAPAFFRGGDAGNFSARTGGPARLVGGDAGFNGIGGLAEVVSGGHLSGTGGSTGAVDVHSLDSDGTFIGTGDVDLHSGDADVSASNKPGNVNIFGGISGLGSGTSAQIGITAGLQRNNAIPAGDITQRGGAHSGTNRGGHIDLGGGLSTSGADGDVLVSVGNFVVTNNVIPDTHLTGSNLGTEAARFGFVFQGAPAYEIETDLDNETFVLAEQGLVYVLASTGVVNIDLLASVLAHTGKTWKIVVRSAANVVNVRRDGTDTINGLAANITLVAGMYFVINVGDGDTSIFGPVAVAP